MVEGDHSFLLALASLFRQPSAGGCHSPLFAARRRIEANAPLRTGGLDRIIPRSRRHSFEAVAEDHWTPERCMRGMKVARGAGLIVAFAVAAQVAEGQVVGAFNGAGSASFVKAPGVGQPIEINFNSPLIAVPVLDGIFATLAPGNTGTLQNVAVGTGVYNLPGFIQIVGYSFALNNVVPGSFSVADCFLAAVAGQTCTFPGTPFNFANVSNGHGGINTTLAFNLSGVVTTPSANSYDYSAIFTSQFTNTSFQSMYNTMESGGTIPVSYSLSIQATAPEDITTTPEPATLAMLGPGLLGLGAFGVVRVRRRVG